jgi:Calx-beta domain-containing protein/List-Bact-rpt repeat protein
MTRRGAVAALGLLSTLMALLTVPGLGGTASAAPDKKPKVSIGDVSVTETDTTGVVATFDVTMTKGLGKKVKVSWSTKAGSATTADFTAASGKVVFKGPEKKQTKQVQVAITGDDVVESDETFQVVLTKVKGGKAKKDAGTATITNDDANHALVVSRSGSGTGTVASTPAGISCGADCSESFSSNAVVTLAATASAGSTFVGWSGACTGTSSCQVAMTADRQVTATFSPLRTLTVAPDGTGTGTVTSSPAGIICPLDCAEDYTLGTTVTLTATPSVSSTFAGWSGGGCSGTGTCVTTLNASTTVVPTFTIKSYTLTATKSGTGGGTVTSSPAGISCGGDCSEVYNHGTAITLTAAAAGNSAFAGWSGGGCTGTATTCTVTLTAATTVNATFSLAPTLTISKTGSGTVTSDPAGISCGADCTENYLTGSSITLTAVAATGFTFTGWSGGGCSGTSTCVVTLNSSTTVTATFTINSYVLTVTLNQPPGGNGHVNSNPAGINCASDCTESYTHGTTVTLQPSAGAGFTFLGWSGGGCSGTGNCVVTLTQATTVTASFNSL